MAVTAATSFIVTLVPAAMLLMSNLLNNGTPLESTILKTINGAMNATVVSGGNSSGDNDSMVLIIRRVKEGSVITVTDGNSSVVDMGTMVGEKEASHPVLPTCCDIANSQGSSDNNVFGCNNGAFGETDGKKMQFWEPPVHFVQSNDKNETIKFR